MIIIDKEIASYNAIVHILWQTISIFLDKEQLLLGIQSNNCVEVLLCVFNQKQNFHTEFRHIRYLFIRHVGDR